MRDERLYLDDIIRASDLIGRFLSGISQDEWADVPALAAVMKEIIRSDFAD